MRITTLLPVLALASVTILLVGAAAFASERGTLDLKIVDASHKDATIDLNNIDCLSFSIRKDVARNNTGSDSQHSDARNHDTIVIRKAIDSTSSAIADAQKTGKEMDAIISFYRTPASGGSEARFLTIRLTRAYITRIIAVRTNDKDYEEITFTYMKIEFEREGHDKTVVNDWSSHT